MGIMDALDYCTLFLLHRKQNMVCYIGQYSKHFDGIVFLLCYIDAILVVSTVMVSTT